jgi:polysaccharide biosynthesis/export protein
MKLANTRIILFIFILGMGSCTRYKDLVYLQDPEVVPSDSLHFKIPEIPEYKIQEKDILYVQINTMNKEIMQVVNLVPVSTSNNIFNSDASYYLYGYDIDKNGDIEIPVVGKINVLGKTLQEAKSAIREKTLNFIKDPTITVKLLSYKYSVFGEVIRPGVYQSFNNELTVLEAISNAGNATTYGNLHEVQVVRSINNENEIFKLDLTDNQILASEGYYLLPNDVVYVKPLKSRNFRNNFPVYTFFLGTVSTIILVVSFVKN